MQNYHRHSCYSNATVSDSAVKNEAYAKRAVELGHKIIASTEHGWQGYYHQVYELAKEHNLKFVFGSEAYWVKDRFEKDRTNAHIVLLARNENGRRAINRVLSDANEEGYYYQARIDIPLILTLPPKDVFVTSACVGFWKYDDVDNIVKRFHRHFGANFMLEIQNHDTDVQRTLNKRIHKLSDKLGIEMIVGLDSHYIFPKQSGERDYVTTARKTQDEGEDGWYMDYPDDQTVFDRFQKQGVFNEDQIQRAMDNADVTLEFEDIEFDTNIKLPTLYPDKTQEEKNKIYSQLITRKFKVYMKDVPEERHKEYYDGVKAEVDVYKNTGMVDYPLIDYEIVKRAVAKGGIITDSGRGSGVGYFTNTLCGFSKIDRFTSTIKLYPERFISESRILETKSLPDLDLNVGNPEAFIAAQTEVLGEGHCYPMIAFGTFKKKSAFKLYAKAKDLDFDIANAISKQLEKYDTAYKYADDDDREDLNIYDFVEEKYHDYITQSKPYWGIVSDKKRHPCAFLLYSGNIREEIGLIKCKSESTKKEYITTVIDGAVAEKYKYLKNDILTVDVVMLIDMIFKRVGINHMTVNELLKTTKEDDKVWDIYAKGWTIGVNQVEKDSTTRKVMKYKPRNISELAAFIAAIRPAFKSMYSKFESREPFSYGIQAFDKLIQTKEFPQSFILYQEQTMQTLNYAGFPIDECYGIIKAISKKHPEKVRPLKERFIEGFSQRIQEDDADATPESAAEMSHQVWKIIDDSCEYGFNAAHAYCMAVDSLYCAYLKAHYPYEFYEVLLQVYSDKGKKDKVAILKQEMMDMGITEGRFEFGADNRRFVADPENKVIYPSLLSIKSLSQRTADELYRFAQSREFGNFYDVYKALKQETNVDSGKLNVLIKIGYFNRFGGVKKILKFMKYIDVLYERSQFSKDAKIPAKVMKIIEKFSDDTTDKQYRKLDYDAALTYIWERIPDAELDIAESMKYEFELLGYTKTLYPEFSPDYAFVQEITRKFKNPKVTMCRLCNGDIETIKVKAKDFDPAPFEVGDIIRTVELSEEGRWFKNDEGKWEQDRTDKEHILKKWRVVR